MNDILLDICYYDHSLAKIRKFANEIDDPYNKSKHNLLLKQLFIDNKIELLFDENLTSLTRNYFHRKTNLVNLRNDNDNDNENDSGNSNSKDVSVTSETKQEVVNVADTADLVDVNMDSVNKDNKNNNDLSDIIDTMRAVGWPTLLQPLIQDFKDELAIPDAKLARIFAKVMIGAMSANEIAFDVFTKHLWSDIEKQYSLSLNNLDKQMSQHQALLDLIVRSVMLLRNLNCKCKKRIESMYQTLIKSLIVEESNSSSKEKKEADNVDDNDSEMKGVGDSSETSDNMNHVINTNSIIFVALSFIIDNKQCDYLSKNEIDGIISKMYQSYQSYNRNKEYCRVVFDSLNRIALKYGDCVTKKFIQPLTIECRVTKSDNTTCKNLRQFLNGVSSLVLKDDNDNFLLDLSMNHLSKLIKQFLINGNEFGELMECMNIVGNMINVNNSKQLIGTMVTQKIVNALVVGFCQETFVVSKSIDDGMVHRLCLMICFIVSRVLSHSKLTENDKEMQQLIDKLISMIWNFKMGDGDTMAQYKLLVILVSLSSIAIKFEITSKGKLLTQLQILIFSLSNQVTNVTLINYYIT